jgi:hypothetical protein
VCVRTESIHNPFCEHYGWERADDDVVWTSSFSDVGAMLENFSILLPVISSLIQQSAAQLTRIIIRAPTSELTRIQEMLTRRSLNQEHVECVEYYSIDNDFQTGFVAQSFKGIANAFPAEQSAQSSTNVTIHPYFIVLDWREVCLIMERFLDKVPEDLGCIYFGWTKKSNRLHWRSTFKDGDAMLQYHGHVAELIELLTAGPAVFDNFDVYGPANEVFKSKYYLDRYHPKYHETYVTARVL